MAIEVTDWVPAASEATDTRKVSQSISIPKISIAPNSRRIKKDNNPAILLYMSFIAALSAIHPASPTFSGDMAGLVALKAILGIAIAGEVISKAEDAANLF